MAKTGEETLPIEVEPSKKVLEDANETLSSSAAKDKVAASPDRKKGLENEEKGAGEGILKTPSIVITPASPLDQSKNRDGKSEDKEDEPANKAEPAKKVEPAKEEPAMKEPAKKEGPAKKEAGEGQTPTFSPSIPIDMSSKMKIRAATWSRLEAEDHVLFPRPCNYRIPRFKGETEAVEKLAQLDIFKNAKLVKVNLDKAHERLRLEIIQSRKELVAGTPGLREAVFLVMHPPMEPSRVANKMAASRIGIHYLGLALDFQAKQADLVILGSVAVDMKGRRIGKGEGFSDLEFALLSKLGTIPSDAVIATLVHDAQVYDEFPDSIFKPYDVPVDVIITPTRVIHVEKKLDRPALRWDLLSKRRIDEIPIIKQLLDKEQASGEKIELKEEDSDTETSRRFPTQRRRFMSRRRQASAPEPRGQMRGRVRRESSAPPPNRGTRTFRRRPRRQTSNSADSPKSERMGQNVPKPTRRGPLRRINKPRYTVDFSVKVNGLSSAVRIRDLKAALVERGVRPSDISWRATKGVALLHFAKRRPIQEPAAATQGKNVNDVVASLQGLSVKPEDGPRMDLIVEVAQPLGPRAALVGPTSA